MRQNRSKWSWKTSLKNQLKHRPSRRDKLITIKLLGGAKKSFNAEMISADFDSITVRKLLEHLKSIKPAGTLEFDAKNILVAVNGVDSSALDGEDTVLRADDTVSIIPIIHGGSSRQIKVDGIPLGLFCVKYKRGLGYDLIENIRKMFPDLTVEGVSGKCILGPSHAKKIVAISLFAQKRGILLSKKLHTDILLRFAGTRQISEAINTAGIKSEASFFLIVIGKRQLQKKMHEFIRQYLANSDDFASPNHLKKRFKISKAHIDSVESSSPLEDILVERAAVLVS